MILRLTKTLNAQLKGDPLDALPLDENPLLDWSVRTFAIETAEYLLLCNTKTLYCVVLSDATFTDMNHFTDRMLGVVRSILDGAARGAVGQGVGPVRFAKPLDRSVTGSMNELVAHAAALLDDRSESLQQVGVRLNEVLLSALRRGTQKYGRPWDEFAALVTRAGG